MLLRGPEPVRVEVSSSLSLRKSETDEKLLGAARAHFQIPIEDSSPVRAYEETETFLRLPRGGYRDLKRIAESLGLRLAPMLDVEDGQDVEMALQGRELREYQKNAAEALVAHAQGCVSMPCGSGKTTVALAAIATLRRRTLVCVHTKDLLAQWSDEIETQFGFKPAIYGAGKKGDDWRESPVTVGMIQTLALTDLPDGFHDRFGVLVLDEAHHVPAITWASVANASRAKVRWGLTATPKREDGLDQLLKWTMGEVVFEVGHEELIQKGHLIRPRILGLKSSFSFDWDGEVSRQSRRYGTALAQKQAWIELAAELAGDPERNKLVAFFARNEATKGRRVLVLSSRIDHLWSLASAYASDEMGDSPCPPAEVLTGSLTRKQRREIVERWRSGSIRVVFATQLADEGLDIPALEVVILAFPSRAKGRTVQRVGRVMRPAWAGKACDVIDVVDERIGPCLGQWRKRLEAYRSMGCKTYEAI